MTRADRVRFVELLEILRKYQSMSVDDWKEFNRLSIQWSSIITEEDHLIREWGASNDSDFDAD